MEEHAAHVEVPVHADALPALPHPDFDGRTGYLRWADELGAFGDVCTEGHRTPHRRSPCASEQMARLCGTRTPRAATAQIEVDSQDGGASCSRDTVTSAGTAANRSAPTEGTRAAADPRW